MDSSHTAPGLGPHAAFIKNKLPDWINHSAVADFKRLKTGIFPGHVSRLAPPAWFTRAPLWLCEALMGAQARSRLANEALARSLKDLQGITQFAEPRLKEALHSHGASGQALDVYSDRLFYLRRNQPVQHQSLLQAALLNFEGNEDFSQRVQGRTSALAPQGALPVGLLRQRQGPDPVELVADALIHGTGLLVGKLKEEWDNLRPVSGFNYRVKRDMSPEVFSRICRALDLGQQYQDHLSDVFDAPGRGAVVRQRMIRAQKELLAVRMHAALMQKQISAPAHDMLKALLRGHPAPRMAGKPVVFSQLSLYGLTLGEVLLIGPYRSWWPVLEWDNTGISGVPLMKHSDMEPLLVYMPGAPSHPLKEYPSLEAFQYELGLNLRLPEYQQLCAGLVPQGSAQTFLARLNHQLFQKKPDPKGIEAPVYVDEVDLRLSVTGIETAPAELFRTLNTLHLERIKANARVLAVPTADADARLLQERLEYYLGLGLDVLNVAAFFIPGAGEVMMAVMALQMGMEVYHGMESWAVGDVEGAWSHLESVALNVALIGVMDGGGRLARNIASGALSKWLDQLTQIVLPNGETRLWQPDLEPYRCEAAFSPQVEPNALGQYRLEGKTYVRVDRHFYEQAHDPQLDAWRIKPPGDDSAYRPLLKHNNAGAWRHSHEQPLQWQRSTLLRRLGHQTEGFDDRVLGQIGDVSGVTDDQLRKVHLEGLPAPALLLDTLEQFRDEQALDALIGPQTSRRDALKQRRASALHNPRQADTDPQIQALRRRFSRLSERAAREVLGQADAKDLERLRLTGRVTGELGNLARHYTQQGRLNRALGGLYLPGLASIDSERLAIEAGLHLASAPGEWQGSVARYATSHREQMARTLKLRVPGSRPALQRINGQIGYALSGRGEAFDSHPSLITRVRDLYPMITDEEAASFIGRQMDEGKNDQQIFAVLANRQRELEALRTTLQQWAGATEESFARRIRQLASDRLIDCWRVRVYREGEAWAYLNLEFDMGLVSDLPALEADFSHVKNLKLSADLMFSEPDLGFVKRFSGVRTLELRIEQDDMHRVARALTRLPTVTGLSLEAGWQGFPPAFMDQLKTVGQLERLTLNGSMPALDVSGWPRLRVLRVSGHLEQWPAGVLELEHLDTLDLFGTSIQALPDSLFSGHERIWSGLLLDWSNIDPGTVLQACQHLRANPGLPVDVEKWSVAYCTGCLTRFMPRDSQFASRAIALLAPGEGALAGLFGRVNSMHAEHRLLGAGVQAWLSRDPSTAHELFHRQVAEKIQRCWSLGVARRLGLEDVSAGPSWRVSQHPVELDLSGGVLSDLPALPGHEAFAHVHRLNMSELGVPAEVLERFLASFTRVHQLNLSRNGLTELPHSLSEFRHLTDLNLAHNDFAVTPLLQSRLNRLSGLEQLNLRGNRVTALDVSAMTRLQSLDLSLTGIRAWPDGALDLGQLQQLDLSRSAIKTLPDALFSGHDGLLAGTKLNGCQLSPESCAGLLACGQRTGRDRVGNIATTLLAAGKTGGTPEFFPIDAVDDPNLLLPGSPSLKTDAVLLTPDPVFDPADPGASRTALLQRANPELSLREAVDCLERLQAQGLGVLEIDARLAAWNRQHDALVQRLNGWINTPSHREGGRWVSAVDRRQAADRIMQSWGQALIPGVTGEPHSLHALDFSDLCLGDIPALTVVQPHITSLNLTGARITAQGSAAFICEFPELRNLQLNNNQLTRLPEGLGSLPNLTRLEASCNRLETEEGVRALAHLQWLDLSHNRLDSFDLTGMDHLQTLNLQGNHLVSWPNRVLTTPALRNLDLSNNQIEYIPTELFEGDNDALMANTNLSDNMLSASGYETLRDYWDFSGHGLGYSLEEIENGLAYVDDSTSSSLADEHNPDENLDHLDNLTPGQLAQQQARWFEGVADDSPKHATWDALRAHGESRGLFYLLDQLQFTQDFIKDRAGLTQRVWEVLEAAESDARLRNELFIIGHSDVTCGDGRILLFSDLEVKVYEFNALKAVVPGQEGPVLLRLARRLFRLGQVEDIAEAAFQAQKGGDAAEIRLAYRISLSKRLDLPAQPKGMQYRRAAKVTAQEIEDAYQRVKAAEASPAFVQQLVLQDYWLNYLKRQHAEEFRALEQRFATEHTALEERHADLGDEYQSDINALDERKKYEVRLLCERLTAQAITSLDPV